jgi:hypothetical protein
MFISKEITSGVNLKNYGCRAIRRVGVDESAAYSESKFNVVGRGSLRCGNGSYILHKTINRFPAKE